ncbi:LytR/AlgR family response regulator transcription factor [Clostridium luticellarii]|jgi:two-component system response regulator LytT|uniref:LytR/AlgR family response regulator transcription factor n=1 Tax=Clostridium luticellarii TaxID=1691940 RepID=UPI002355FFDB|nr:LytTR family DNA-binding domain-containing protein [Clostridium luticellarii]MCI1946044.1 LytTR family DNA-binding domain-containing protein [Clostridium luticellarii]MCI1969320.1 LytTR family DNA-binding domain-containing protein [Clostridium luticellarii]MCI1995476.1 LytTR family DNA-binding domain-containing protein [Clostridium luticellarii]MCI2040381.1 LytTR family DNA-binding domain-containing protein [Clostridium luticellarii]
MDKLRCVIVEDEIPAAEELSYIISQYEDISVEGIAYDGKSGMEIIKTKKPDAVFLDINMPVENGIEVAKNIKEFYDDIDIIFVTAYEEHAVKAFELNALDYVLKPFDENRIAITIDRLIQRKHIKDAEDEKIPNDILNELIDKMDKEKNLVKRIPCERQGKIILVSVDDIYYCYIKDEKTYVKVKDDSYLVGYTLGQIEKRTNFFRSHRSFLVNIDNIKELYSWFNGTYKLVMDDKEKSEIPISRNNVKKLKELLKM